MDFFDFIDGITSDVDNAFGRIAALVIVIVLLVVMAQSRFSIAKVVIGLVVGALAFWCILGGGIEGLGSMFGSTVDSYENGAAVIATTDPGPASS